MYNNCILSQTGLSFILCILMAGKADFFLAQFVKLICINNKNLKVNLIFG